MSDSDEGCHSETELLPMDDELPYAPVGAAERKHRSQFALGLGFIFAVALIWAGASVLVQHIEDDLDFDSPFFITYVSNSLFMLYLPLYALLVRVGLVAPVRMGSKKDLLEAPTPVVVAASSVGGGDGDEPEEYSVMRCARIGAIVCPFWFMAQFSYNASLDLTSVTSSTVISTTSSLFTFLFAVFIIRCERFSKAKLAGVAACMAGTIIVSLADSDSGDGESVWGDLVALFSAFMYGVYTTAIRYHIPNDDAVRMPLFFGFLGLVNLFILTPILLTLNATGLETLDGLTWGVLGLVVFKGVADNVLSDYLWARAMVLTSPTIATVGLSLTIPLAIGSDIVLGKGGVTAESVCGAVLVIVGFVLVTASEEIHAWWKRRKTGSAEALLQAS